MEMSGQLHVPAALFLGKRPWYLLDSRVGRPQSRFERGVEEKKNPFPLRESNPGLQARSSVTILIELSVYRGFYREIDFEECLEDSDYL
jgi:hypothetical protein